MFFSEGKCLPQGSNVYLRAIMFTLEGKCLPQGNKVYLRAILHEDEHLLPMDLHSKVVDQVGVVDRFKDSQLVCHVPDDQYNHDDCDKFLHYKLADRVRMVYWLKPSHFISHMIMMVIFMAMMMRMTIMILLQGFVIVGLERYLLHCHDVSCLVVDRSVNFSKVTLTCDHGLDNDDQHPTSRIGFCTYTCVAFGMLHLLFGYGGWVW